MRGRRIGRGDRERVSVGIGVAGEDTDVPGTCPRSRQRLVIGDRRRVRSRSHRDADRSRVRSTVTVRDRVRERVGPGVPCGGRVGADARGLARDRSVAGGGRRGRDREGVSVDVRVVCEHVHAPRRVLSSRQRVVDRVRVVVHRRDSHRQGRRVRATVAVRDSVGEGVRPGVVGCRRVGTDPGRGTGNRAVRCGRGGRRHSERVPVGVRVVGEHVQVPGRVLSRRQRVVDCVRRVVDRRDRDRDVARVRAAVAVRDGVVEAVRPVVVRARRVGANAGRRAGDAPVRGRRIGRGDRERVSVGIGVAGEDTDVPGRVLGSRQRLVIGDRRLVGRRRDRDRDGRLVGPSRTVGQVVGERVRPDVAGVGV